MYIPCICSFSRFMIDHWSLTPFDDRPWKFSRFRTLLISPRYHVSTSNSLQNIRQNHWTMKYRWQWPIFILRSNVKSYWLISPCYHVYTSNSLQNMRQNHWPWNIGHSDPLLFWGQASSHAGSLVQGIMFIHQKAFKIWGKNHWTMKYRSQWPTFI